MKAFISMIILTLVSVFTMNAYAEPAIVFEGDICYVEFDPDPSLDPDVEPGSSLIGLLGDKVHATVAVSGNNETFFAPGIVTCQGYDDFGLERAVVVRLPCIVFDTPGFGTIVTENGMVALAPSGNWTAQCMFRKATGRQN